MGRLCLAMDETGPHCQVITRKSSTINFITHQPEKGLFLSDYLVAILVMSTVKPMPPRDVNGRQKYLSVGVFAIDVWRES